jgi:XTP/dITP diphosphohydrolase
LPETKLLIATNNRGKLSEIKRILEGLSIRVVSPDDLGKAAPEFPENGTTFRENAVEKARAWSRFSGMACLADDSGLCVEALDGAPGVYSARFSGEGANDHRNNEKLLRRLEDIPDSGRQARFVCCIALQLPGKTEITFEGEVQGTILREPRGSNGFGYDPLFFYSPLGLTFAELEREVKNRVSHRAQALGKMRKWIEEHPDSI